MSRVSKKTKHKIPNSITEYLHHYVGHLNNSKMFAGIVMILLNVGTKLVPIQISLSAEEYMKKSISKHILVFAMAWMGTRDIYTALGLTAVFILLSEYMFNDKSKLCIVPNMYKSESIRNQGDDQQPKVTQADIANVIKTLEDMKSKI
jgi:hypothetical protein